MRLNFRALPDALQAFRTQHVNATFRRKVYLLLNVQPRPDHLQVTIEKTLMVLIALSVVSVILESIGGLHETYEAVFFWTEAVFVTIFTLELAARIYAAPEDPKFHHCHPLRLRFLLRPGQLTDLVAILPFYLSLLFPGELDLRFLRVFRLLRVLKLLRHSRASRTLVNVLQKEWPVIASAVFIMLLFVVATASIGFLFEHEAQPEKFENIPQSIYWAVITLASVGYGDISPVTEGGRIATVIASLAGIGIFALPAAILSSAFVDQLHRDREQLREDLAKALEDGELSESERKHIVRRAESLSLTEEEINQTIRRHAEAAERQRNQIGPHMALESASWDSNPEFALTQFRLSLAWMQAATRNTPAESPIHQIMKDPERTNDVERAVWTALRGKT
ncbi:Ion transport domain containing protein [Burkholderiales bacterium]